jgi:small subunit ribosomal protein S1
VASNRTKLKQTPQKASKKTPRPQRQTSKTPKTMEELLAQADEKFRVLSVGNIVDGKVISITPKAVYIDVGAKSEGIVVGQEYTLVKDFIETLSAGDVIKVYVRNPEDDQGNVILSLRKAANDALWGKMHQFLQSGETIEVRGIDTNKGGVLVRVNGLHGFIPSSQLLPEHVGSGKDLVNKTLMVKIIEVNRSKNRLVLAEKRVVPEGERKKRRQVWSKLKEGDVVKGKVASIVPIGALIKVDDVLDALLHLSEISWEKVENPEDYLKVGQEVEVKVIEKGEDENGLRVSLKQLAEDPWQKVKEKYKEGQEVSGTVVRKASYGFFVELEPGVEGLIYISKITGEHDIEVGKEVQCFVERIDLDNRRISLSIVPTEVPTIYK